MVIFNCILAFILFLCVLKWDVETDYKKFLKHIPVKHFQEGVLRACLLAPSILLLAYPLTIVSILISIGLVGSIWWEFFDGWYNKKRNFKWRFNGSVDKDDSILDKFLYKIGDTWESILKWSLILIFLTLYILLKINLVFSTK